MPRRSPTPADRHRLAALLGMVGSAFDAEALNAARLADRFVRERGLTWGEILAPPAPDRLEGDDVAVLLRSWPTSWRSLAYACRSSGAVFGHRDRQFLDAIMGWIGDPSPKQLGWLRSIAERVLAAGGVS